MEPSIKQRYHALCVKVGNLCFRRKDLEQELASINAALKEADETRLQLQKELQDASTVQDPSSPS